MGITHKKFFSWTNFFLISFWLTAIISIGAVAYQKIQASTLESKEKPETFIVQWETLKVQIQTNGVIQAQKKINLSPLESGKIAQLYVKEGDMVKPGQLIAKMDSSALETQLEQYQALVTKAKAELAVKLAGSLREEIAQAQARIELEEANIAGVKTRINYAEDEVTRYQLLVTQGAISQSDFKKVISELQLEENNLLVAKAKRKEQEAAFAQIDRGVRVEEIEQAKANLAATEAQLKFYQNQLQKTYIYAPFAGTITRLFAQIGDFVTPTTTASGNEGSTSTSIAELMSGMEIEAKLPEVTLGEIKEGQKVIVRVEAYPDRILQGKVRAIAPTAVQKDNLTFFPIKVVLENPPGYLRFGMNSKLDFQVSQIEKAIVVPITAILTQKDGTTGVFLSNGEKEERFQPVTLGKTSPNRIQILQGLQVGEKVLLSPPPDLTIDGVDNL